MATLRGGREHDQPSGAGILGIPEVKGPRMSGRFYYLCWDSGMQAVGHPADCGLAPPGQK